MSWSFNTSGSPESVKQLAAQYFGQPYLSTMQQPEQSTVRNVHAIIESTCDGARPGAYISVSAYGSQSWVPGMPGGNNSVNLSITTSGS